MFARLHVCCLYLCLCVCITAPVNGKVVILCGFARRLFTRTIPLFCKNRKLDSLYVTRAVYGNRFTSGFHSSTFARYCKSTPGIRGYCIWTLHDPFTIRPASRPVAYQAAARGLRRGA